MNDISETLNLSDFNKKTLKRIRLFELLFRSLNRKVRQLLHIT